MFVFDHNKSREKYLDSDNIIASFRLPFFVLIGLVYTEFHVRRIIDCSLINYSAIHPSVSLT